MTYKCRFEFDVITEEEFDQIRLWFKTFKPEFVWWLGDEGTSLWDDYRNIS